MARAALDRTRREVQKLEARQRWRCRGVRQSSLVLLLVWSTGRGWDDWQESTALHLVIVDESWVTIIKEVPLSGPAVVAAGGDRAFASISRLWTLQEKLAAMANGNARTRDCEKTSPKSVQRHVRRRCSGFRVLPSRFAKHQVPPLSLMVATCLVRTAWVCHRFDESLEMMDSAFASSRAPIPYTHSSSKYYATFSRIPNHTGVCLYRCFRNIS